MSTPFELYIGYRYLNAKYRESFISLITFLSVAGVMVGVMTLIVVIAVMSGTESHLRTLLLKDQPHIMLTRHGTLFSNYREIMKRVKEFDGVESASPYIYAQVMLRSKKGMTGAILKGLEAGAPGFPVKGFKTMKKTGGEQAPGIVLGKEVAEKLQVKEGDQVVYMVFSKARGLSVRLPAMKRFKVAGVFESGLYKSFTCVRLEDAQKILKMGDAVTGLEIRVREIFNAGKIVEKINRDFGYTYWANDWTMSNQNLFRALKLQKTVMFIILTLIVIVAGFCITGTLTMTVIEKTKDIAILKAMGVTDASIKIIFVFKGMTIGFIGTVLGICYGFVICVLLKHYKFIDLPESVYYFTKLPVKLEIPDVALISASALAICFIATLYPAHRASKLDPVEAIRNS